MVSVAAGGGWYGGYMNNVRYKSAGSGGSGYIGGTANGQMTSGVRNGDGAAKITLLFKGPDPIAEVPTVDVTGAPTKNTKLQEHSCKDFKAKKFDEYGHWYECTICSQLYIDDGRPDDENYENDYLVIAENHNGQRMLIFENTYKDHSMINYHIISNDSCEPENRIINKCRDECGYGFVEENDIGHASTYLVKNNAYHVRCCSRCGAEVEGYKKHSDASGVLGCSTNRSGTCSTCGMNVTTNHYANAVYDVVNRRFLNNHDMKCCNCKRALLSNNDVSLILVNEADGSFFLEIAMSFGKNISGYTNSEIGSFVNSSDGTVTSYSNVLNPIQQDGIHINMTGEYIGRKLAGGIKLKATHLTNIYYTDSIPHEDPVTHLTTYTNVTRNSEIEFFVIVSPDVEKPNVQDISQEYVVYNNANLLNRIITISGTENHCKDLYVKIKNKNTNELIYDGIMSVNDGYFETHVSPPIDYSNLPIEIDISVSDTMGNESVHSFTLSKLDETPPQFIHGEDERTKGSESYWGTDYNWSKEKNFRIITYDAEADYCITKIQNVPNTNNDIVFYDEFGANWIDIEASPKEFIRDYTFTGDVNGYVTLEAASIDFSENIGLDYFRVYNLDNTGPYVDGSVTFNPAQKEIYVKISDAGSGVKYFGLVPYGSGTVNYPTTYGASPTTTSVSLSAWSLVQTIPENVQEGIPASGQSSVEVTLKVTSNGKYFIVMEDYLGNRSYYEYLVENLDYNSLIISKGFLDVTGAIADSSNEISHECNQNMIQKYDGVYHWNECSICSSKYINAGRPDDATGWTNTYLEIKKNANNQNVLVIQDSFFEHNYTNDYWSMGSSDVCLNGNIHYFVCDCGYSHTSTEGKREHVFSSDSYFWNRYYKRCENCTDVVMIHTCEVSPGVEMNCTNWGVCHMCGHDWATATPYHQTVFQDDSITDRDLESSYGTSGKIICWMCREGFGEIRRYNSLNVITPGQEVEVVSTWQLSPSVQYDDRYDKVNLSSDDAGLRILGTTRTVNGNMVTLRTRIAYDRHVETDQIRLEQAIWFTYNGRWVVSAGGYRDSNGGMAKPEVTPPTITNVTQDVVSSNNGWATNSNIIVSGTENYCSSVSVSMKNKTTGEIVYTGTASVSGSTYSLSFTPDIEAGTTAQVYQITVTDNLGNTSAVREISISQYDRIPPEVIKTSQMSWYIDQNMWGTTIPWTKTKDFDITLTDEGTNFVEAKIQNVTSTKTHETFVDKYGTTRIDKSSMPYKYTREYGFTGDVKGYVTLKTMAKDDAGNLREEFFRVYNLDNSNPEITDISYKTTSINEVQATLKDAHSGIKYYGVIPYEFGVVRYPTVYSDEVGGKAVELNKWYCAELIPENPITGEPECGPSELQIDIKFPENGEYYIVTEDYVGNRNYYAFAADRLDENPPYGFIDLKNPLISIDGDRGSKRQTVTLLIDGRDDETEVVEFSLANENSKNVIGWIDYLERYKTDGYEWDLSEEDGHKIVYVMFKDLQGNVSVTYVP